MTNSKTSTTLRGFPPLHGYANRPQRRLSRLLAPRRDLPDNFGPRTTCYNRFVRWRRADVRDKLMSALAGTHSAAVQMIDHVDCSRASTSGVHHTEPETVDGTVTRWIDQHDSCARRYERLARPARADSR
jgi:transposase